MLLWSVRRTFANSFHSGYAIRVIIRAVHHRFSVTERSVGDRLVPGGIQMTKEAQRVATDVPSVDAITPYDETHFDMYVRILDASERPQHRVWLDRDGRLLPDSKHDLEAMVSKEPRLLALCL